MRNLIIALAVLLALAAPALAADQAVPTTATVVDAALLKDYAGRLGISGQGDERGFKGTANFDGKSYEMLFSADPQRFVAYMAVLDIAPLRADDPQRCAKLERAMELNFRMALGKLEWDRDAGALRLSHAFSTESGLSYDVFRGVLLTLLSAVDPLRAELAAAR